MNKNILRANFRTVRSKIENRAQKDADIFKKVSAFLDNKHYKKIFTFVSMKDEVDTARLIEYYINKDGFTILIPKTHNNEMQMVKTNMGMLNIVDKYGNTDVALKSDIYEGGADVAIVPMLAFSSDFYRLGNGGGHYDKYLSKFKTYSVGIAYDEQFCPDFAPEVHDIPLDAIITPTKVLIREQIK